MNFFREKSINYFTTKVTLLKSRTWLLHRISIPNIVLESFWCYCIGKARPNWNVYKYNIPHISHFRSVSQYLNNLQFLRMLKKIMMKYFFFFGFSFLLHWNQKSNKIKAWKRFESEQGRLIIALIRSSLQIQNDDFSAYGYEWWIV